MGTKTAKQNGGVRPKMTEAEATGKIKKVKAEEVVKISAINLQKINLDIVGTSDLIVHKFSDKTRIQMEGKQQGAAKQGKGKRNPQDEYEQCFYHMPAKKGKLGKAAFPSIAFKQAAVRAGQFADMKMVFLRGAFHVDGELIPLEYDEVEMRTDMVRIGAGVADMRYRPGFKNWTVTLPITYNASVISSEQIINLFNIAGFAVGVGDWRPTSKQSSGQFGRFEVRSD